MNTKNVKRPNLKLFISFCILSIILGVILHFTYNFLNKPFIIGLFIPINESIWEHLKLVLIPITGFGLLYNLLYAKETYKLNNFWYYTARSIILSMLVIVFGHYTYKFIFKSVPGIVNIIIYIISIIIAFYSIYTNMKEQYISEKTNNKNNNGIRILVFLFMLFIVFTIYPPKLELFRDPINSTFGIFML